MITTTIKDFVQDKRVVLVGNSVEMMEYEHGDFIDSFDVVIHHGAAIRRTEEQCKSLGNRTDIWITGSFRSKSYWDKQSEFLDGKYKDTILLFNRVRTKLLNIDDKPLWEASLPAIPRIDMFSDFELLDILQELNYLDGFGDGYRGPRSGQRPSGGFIALLYL